MSLDPGYAATVVNAQHTTGALDTALCDVAVELVIELGCEHRVVDHSGAGSSDAVALTVEPVGETPLRLLRHFIISHGKVLLV